MSSHPVRHCDNGNYWTDRCHQTQMIDPQKDMWVLDHKLQPWNQTPSSVLALSTGWVALSSPLSCFIVCLLAPMMHSTVTVLSPQRRLYVSSEDPVNQCLCAVKSRPEKKWAHWCRAVFETFAFSSAERESVNCLMWKVAAWSHSRRSTFDLTLTLKSFHLHFPVHEILHQLIAGK